MHVVLFATHNGQNTETHVLGLPAVPSWNDFHRPTPLDFEEVHRRGVLQISSKRVTHLTKEYPRDVRILYLAIGPVSHDIVKRYQSSVAGSRGVYSKYRQLILCHRELLAQRILEPGQVYLAIATPSKVRFKARAAEFQERLKQTKMAEQTSVKMEEGEEEDKKDEPSLLSRIQQVHSTTQATVEGDVDQCSRLVNPLTLASMDKMARQTLVKELQEECEAVDDAVGTWMDIQRTHGQSLRRAKRAVESVEASKQRGESIRKFFGECASVHAEYAKGLTADVRDLKKPVKEMDASVGETFAAAHQIVRDIHVEIQNTQTTWTIEFGDTLRLSTPDGCKSKGRGSVVMTFNPDAEYALVDWSQLEAFEIKAPDGKPTPAPEQHFQNYQKTVLRYVDKKLREMYKSRSDSAKKMWITTSDIVKEMSQHNSPLSPIRLVVAFAVLHMHLGTACAEEDNADAGTIDGGMVLALNALRIYRNFQEAYVIPSDGSSMKKRVKNETKKAAKGMLDLEASSSSSSSEPKKKKKEKKAEMEYKPTEEEVERAAKEEESADEEAEKEEKETPPVKMEDKKESSEEEEEESSEEEEEEEEEEEDESSEDDEGNDAEDKARFKAERAAEKKENAKKLAELKKKEQEEEAKRVALKRKKEQPVDSSSDEEEEEEEEKKPVKESPTKKQKT
jgi:hypothetical protein